MVHKSVVSHQAVKPAEHLDNLIACSRIHVFFYFTATNVPSVMLIGFPFSSGFGGVFDFGGFTLGVFTLGAFTLGVSRRPFPRQTVWQLHSYTILISELGNATLPSRKNIHKQHQPSKCCCTLRTFPQTSPCYILYPLVAAFHTH